MSVRLLTQYIVEALGGPNPSATGKDMHAGNLYSTGAGEPVASVRSTGSNLIDDETEAEKADLQDRKHAACCLVLRKDGKVLAVSRKDDPTAFGLPGGKVDFPEEPIAAAARELEEETGLVATNLHQVFVHGEDDGYVTHTFVCKVEGDIDTDEAGVVKWVHPDELFNGPFGTYNRMLWDKLNLPVSKS